VRKSLVGSSAFLVMTMVTGRNRECVRTPAASIMKPSKEWHVRLEETKRRSVLAVLLERNNEILAHLAPLAAREALLL
jgi:hypothetical protein